MCQSMRRSMVAHVLVNVVNVAAAARACLEADLAKLQEPDFLLAFHPYVDILQSEEGFMHETCTGRQSRLDESDTCCTVIWLTKTGHHGRR